MANGRTICVKLDECQFEPGEIGVTTYTFLSTDRLSTCNVISAVRDLIQSHEVVASCTDRGTRHEIPLTLAQTACDVYKRGFATWCQFVDTDCTTAAAVRRQLLVTLTGCIFSAKRSRWGVWFCPPIEGQCRLPLATMATYSTLRAGL